MQDNIFPGSPEDWLRHAQSDLAYAKYKDSDVLLNQKCYHCQQCVEKCIKSVLIKYGIPLQKIHDIQKLISSLPTVLELPEYLEHVLKLALRPHHLASPRALRMVRSDLKHFQKLVLGHVLNRKLNTFGVCSRITISG